MPRGKMFTAEQNNWKIVESDFRGLLTLGRDAAYGGERTVAAASDARHQLRHQPDMPSYCKSLEHLLRYCARPPFALERLFVIRGGDGRISRIRYVLPRHKAANWVGPGRGRKTTRPGANGVVERSPCDFLNRLADLVPPPRKYLHGDCCDSCDKAPSHDTSRRQRPNSWRGWGKSFLLRALGCGGDIHRRACLP